ncbi:MAG: Nif3-like dinuclear metal center hexameric protein [Lachnospiraceae bacterium]|nr:Nif3-like dinuclear metal center hexameric protein [Lachnospiraceae bacterium]
MLLGEILDRLDALSPSSFALDWDNSGFLVGDRDSEVRRVLIAVDATKEVIEEAVEKRADLILTHHPMIFSPLKRIVKEDVIGEKVLMLAENHISLVCMHTNFDVIGMADEVADRLMLKHKRVLDVTFEDDISKEGIGRYGTLPREMSLKELADQVKLKFDIPGVIMYGEGDAIVNLEGHPLAERRQEHLTAVAGRTDALSGNGLTAVYRHWTQRHEMSVLLQTRYHDHGTPVHNIGIIHPESHYDGKRIAHTYGRKVGKKTGKGGRPFVTDTRQRRDRYQNGQNQKQ